MLRRQVHDHRPLLLFGQFDDDHLPTSVGFSRCGGCEVSGSMRMRYFASCTRGRIRPGLDELRSRRQPNAKLIECSAVTADGEPRIAPHAAPVDRHPDGAQRVEDRGDRRRILGGRLPRQAEQAGRAGHLHYRCAVRSRILRKERAALARASEIAESDFQGQVATTTPVGS